MTAHRSGWSHINGGRCIANSALDRKKCRGSYRWRHTDFVVACGWRICRASGCVLSTHSCTRIDNLVHILWEDGYRRFNRTRYTWTIQRCMFFRVGRADGWCQVRRGVFRGFFCLLRDDIRGCSDSSLPFRRLYGLSMVSQLYPAKKRTSPTFF